MLEIINEFLGKITGKEKLPEKEKLPKYPEVILRKIHHSEQQIKGDPHSVGGDYWLRGLDLLKSKDPLITLEQFSKGGNGVVVMDTATRQTRGETPAETTKPFAWHFLYIYYYLLPRLLRRILYT